MEAVKLNNMTQQQPTPIQVYQADDEISLVDLILVLFRRKTAVGLTVIICLALALSYGFTRPQMETYTTTLKIGGVTTPIEATPRTMAKLTENYIPTSNIGLDFDFNVETRSPKGSDFIILETVSTTKNKKDIEKLHNTIAQKLIKDHAVLITTRRASISAEIDRLSQTIDGMRNSNYLMSLTADIESTRKKLLKQNITDEYRESLKDVLRFLQTELASKEQNSTLQLIDYQSQLNDLQRQLDSLSGSSLFTNTIGQKENSKSPIVIAVLGVILGIMLGVFLAFILELVAKTKEAQKAQKAQKAQS